MNISEKLHQFHVRHVPGDLVTDIKYQVMIRKQSGEVTSQNQFLHLLMRKGLEKLREEGRGVSRGRRIPCNIMDVDPGEQYGF